MVLVGVGRAYQKRGTFLLLRERRFPLLRKESTPPLRMTMYLLKRRDLVVASERSMPGEGRGLALCRREKRGSAESSTEPDCSFRGGELGLSAFHYLTERKCSGSSAGEVK